MCLETYYTKKIKKDVRELKTTIKMSIRAEYFASNQIEEVFFYVIKFSSSPQNSALMPISVYTPRIDESRMG